ncbi:MAG: DNA recombination/repair protein RecA, partial [Actinobacteria bacterium]
YLRDNPDLAMQLQDQVLRAVGVIEDEDAETDVEETESAPAEEES